MSRTVHHVPVGRRQRAWNPHDAYWSRHQVDDLRYSTLVEVEAARLARRPLPQRTTRMRAFHRLPRATSNRGYAYYRQAAARRNRRCDRTALRQLVRELDAVALRCGADTAAGAADDVMPALTHPVREADWQVW